MQPAQAGAVHASNRKKAAAALPEKRRQLVGARFELVGGRVREQYDGVVGVQVLPALHVVHDDVESLRLERLGDERLALLGREA